MKRKKIGSLNRGGKILPLLLLAPSCVSSAHSSNHHRRRGLHISVTPKITLASANTNHKMPSSNKVVDLEELGLAPGLDKLEELHALVQTGGSTAKQERRKWWSHPVLAMSVVASAVYYWARQEGPALEDYRNRIMRGGRQPQQQQNKKKRTATPADDHPLALQSEAVIQQRGVLAWLTSPEKLPWTLSAVASLLYLAAFVSRVSCDKENTLASLCWKPLTTWTQGLDNGFCVWGADPVTGICESALQNSHQFSFYIDTGLAILALAVGKWTHASGLFTLGVALLIGLHGLLHLGISNGMECTPGNWMHCCLSCPNNAAPSTEPWQWILYALYNLGVVLLNFSVANFRLAKSLQAVLVIGITALFVALGAFVGSAWALSAVFVQTHVLASLTGVFANRFAITPLTGWCFGAATLVGCTEFLACQPFLLARYGHVWYDAALHLAMMATFVPRKNKTVIVAP